jgi:hypothetical protein
MNRRFERFTMDNVRRWIFDNIDDLDDMDALDVACVVVVVFGVNRPPIPYDDMYMDRPPDPEGADWQVKAYTKKVSKVQDKILNWAPGKTVSKSELNKELGGNVSAAVIDRALYEHESAEVIRVFEMDVESGRRPVMIERLDSIFDDMSL